MAKKGEDILDLKGYQELDLSEEFRAGRTSKGEWDVDMRISLPFDDETPAGPQDRG